MRRGSSMLGSGSSRGLGAVGVGVGEPNPENAPDFDMNSARAAIPVAVPRSSDRARFLEALVSTLRWELYLGQSLMMWFLDSMVKSSHGHVMGSGDRGRKAWRNSPV